MCEHSLVSGEDRRFQRPWSKYFHEHDVKELIEFFTTGQLDRWIDYAGITGVSAAYIRNQLNLPV